MKKKIDSRSVIWDKAFYINVASNIDRDIYMKKEFKKHNLQVERFNAIDKNNINDTYINKLVSKNILTRDNVIIKNRKFGSLACLLSHCLLWDKIYNHEPGKIFLIFEDDCYLDNNFKQQCITYLEFLPDDWDMVWLGYNNFLGNDVGNIFNKPLNLKKDVLLPFFRLFGTNAEHHCYLINKDSIPKIKNLFFPYNGEKTKDIIMRENFHKFNAYFLFKKLAFQDTINLPSYRKSS